jgi:hypothetical protein
MKDNNRNYKRGIYKKVSRETKAEILEAISKIVFEQNELSNKVHHGKPCKKTRTV